MVDKLTVSDTTEEVVTTKVVTATFTFTDTDLLDPEIKRFYDMIAPLAEEEEVADEEDDESLFNDN